MQPSERRNPLARRQDEEIALAASGNGQREIEIELIRRDGGTQPRDGISQLHVADMRIALQHSKPLPPVEVIYDGESYWLWDGFHRIEAHIAEERTTIAANVRQGTLQDAQWESYSVNAGHGLKRSNADKERQVRNALRHPKAQGMSNAQVAKHVGVDDKTVARYRFEMQAASEIPSLTSRQGADGKNYPALAPRLSKPAPPPEPTTRPLTDEETRHLVWRTIKAEVEIAPSATAVFRWQRYLDWLARHSEPKHFKPHLFDVTRSIDGQLLVNATITVGTEIELNLGSAKRAAQPTQPNPTTVDEETSEAPPTDPAALPADLVERGWVLREMAATGRWWCFNPNGPRATSPHDTIEQAARAARLMQVDVAKPTVKPAGGDEVTVALRRIEEAVADLVERLGLDMLRVRLDERQDNPWSLLASKGDNELNWSHANIVGVSSALVNLGRKGAK